MFPKRKLRMGGAPEAPPKFHAALLKFPVDAHSHPLAVQARAPFGIETDPGSGAGVTPLR